MIASSFYAEANVVKNFLGGKAKHYSVRPPTTVVKKYPYFLKRGDTMYSLAEKVFGKDQQHLWYIIADCNSLREIDSWEENDVVYLPELIVKDAPVDSRRASATSSKAVVFPKANTTSSSSESGGGENGGSTGGVTIIGAVTFIELLDTPSYFEALKLLRVNADADALEYIDEGDIDHNKLFNFEVERHRHMVYDSHIKAYLIND